MSRRVRSSSLVWGLALAGALAVLPAGPAAAANLLELNFWLSGPRFDGKTPDEWREHTAHRITFSNNIVAEALSHSTHWKIEHSKGALIHDNTTDIALVGNLFACFDPGEHGTGRVEVFLTQAVSSDELTWEALVHPGKKMRTGERIFLSEDLTAEILGRGQFGERTVRLGRGPA